MLCKKKHFSNNPVYMDTSEIRLPDKCRKSAMKIKVLLQRPCYFWEAYLILSWDMYSLSVKTTFKMHTFSSELSPFTIMREARLAGAGTYADQIHRWNAGLRRLHVLIIQKIAQETRCFNWCMLTSILTLSRFKISNYCACKLLLFFNLYLTR